MLNEAVGHSMSKLCNFQEINLVLKTSYDGIAPVDYICATCINEGYMHAVTSLYMLKWVAPICRIVSAVPEYGHFRSSSLSHPTVS